jgi:hypothetical protein
MPASCPWSSWCCVPAPAPLARIRAVASADQLPELNAAIRGALAGFSLHYELAFETAGNTGE